MEAPGGHTSAGCTSGIGLHARVVAERGFRLAHLVVVLAVEVVDDVVSVDPGGHGHGDGRRDRAGGHRALGGGQTTVSSFPTNCHAPVGLRRQGRHQNAVAVHSEVLNRAQELGHLRGCRRVCA